VAPYPPRSFHPLSDIPDRKNLRDISFSSHIGFVLVFKSWWGHLSVGWLKTQLFSYIKVGLS
jgi:hypothetical protein